jgi:DNA modification methylase
MILHGDCLEVMKTLPDKSIDLFLCDLPYGCLTGRAGKEKTKRREKGSTDSIAGCSWDIPIDLEKFWEQVERLMKDDHTPIIHFCNTKFGYELMKSKEKWFRYDLIWDKQVGVGFLSVNKMPMRSHENIYVFAKKGARYYRKDIEGDFNKWLVGKNGKRGGNYADAGLPKANISGGEGKRCVLSVIQSKTARSNQKGEKREHKHPTQKPEDLYAWLIERYSKEGDTMLDATAGSFTSVFTAEKLGRKGIGIEMNEEFYKKALERSK